MTTAGAHDAGIVRRTAKLNVAAACVLVAVKLGAGVASNSLGLLAEAAHSATDLIAAILTLYAVTVALRPPDREHHYGHGKAEHLAALGESAFLMLVSLFIGYESIARLTDSGAHEVDPAWWIFIVLALVMGLDAFRAINSHRIAKLHNSPALRANTLHFASDLAGTLAVLVGLILVSAGVGEADSVAALFVAVLVVVAAMRLALQAIDVLMDRASIEAEDAIRREIEAIDGVELRRLRVRHAAGGSFADIVVGVSPDAGVTQAHATADEIESRVERALTDADVVVHVEPMTAEGTVRERATVAAAKVPAAREIHNVRVLKVDGSRELSLHVKLPRALSLADAHEIVEDLERSILADVPEISRVHTHIEPLSRTYEASEPDGPQAASERESIDAVVRELTGAPARSIELRQSGHRRIALVTITVEGDATLPAAHHVAGKVEEEIRAACELLDEVVVHTEPR